MLGGPGTCSIDFDYLCGLKIEIVICGTIVLCGSTRTRNRVSYDRLVNFSDLRSSIQVPRSFSSASLLRRGPISSFTQEELITERMATIKGKRVFIFKHVGVAQIDNKHKQYALQANSFS